MTITIENYNSPSTTFFNSSSFVNESPTKISSINSNSYFGQGCTNLPGLSNLFVAPYQFYQGASASYKAYQVGDKEGFVENSIRTAATPFSFANAGLQLSSYVIQLGISFKYIQGHFVATLLKLSNWLAIAGIPFCLADAALETLGITRVSRFLKKNYPFALETIKKTNVPLTEEGYLHHLQRLRQKYFTVNPTEKIKIEAHLETLSSTQEKFTYRVEKENAYLTKQKNYLIRRMGQRLTKELEQKIDPIIEGLQSYSASQRAEAREKAEEIFNDLHIQSQKLLLIHSIGLAAALVTLAAVILGFFTMPFFVPIIVLIGGALLSLTRYYLTVGLLESRNWEFVPERCIPSWWKWLRKEEAPVNFSPLQANREENNWWQNLGLNPKFTYSVGT